MQQIRISSISLKISPDRDVIFKVSHPIGARCEDLRSLFMYPAPMHHVNTQIFSHSVPLHVVYMVTMVTNLYAIFRTLHRGSLDDGNLILVSPLIVSLKVR